MKTMLPVGLLPPVSVALSLSLSPIVAVVGLGVVLMVGLKTCVLLKLTLPEQEGKSMLVDWLVSITQPLTASSLTV